MSARPVPEDWEYDEAVARVLHDRINVIERAAMNRGGDDPMTPEEIVLYLRACVTDDAGKIAAALPHLAQHVSPSMEEAREVLLRGGWIDVPDLVPHIDGEAEVMRFVTALFSSTPTVEQVRRETLAEAEALIRPSIRIESTEDHFDVVTANTALHRAADRIARAAEAVDRG